MKSAESKLVLFLASPEISESEFDRIAQLFDTRELSKFVSAAAYLRNESRSARDYIKRREREVLHGFNTPQVEPAFFKEVSQLLSTTELTAAEAIRRIAQELRLDVQIPRTRSLRSGLIHLLGFADIHEVWAAIQRVVAKSKRASNPKQPWPLRVQEPDGDI